MGKIIVPNWDDVYISMIYLVASKSKDKRTHIGAVIVGPDNDFRSIGYNSFPRGLNDNISERQEPEEKPFWFEHAERNAIYNVTRVGGASLKGCKMYTNGIPCADCAHGVIQSGISKVIVDRDWNSDNAGGKWEEHAKRTIKMFEEAKVKIQYWEGDLVKIKKFRRGKILPHRKT